MKDRRLSVLLVEDNRDDAELIRGMLAGGELSLDTAGTLAAAQTRLARGGIDVVLLDLHLPDTTGTSGLATMLRARPELPVVVLTGLDDESVGLHAVEEGAQDYLVKGQVDRRLLDRSLRYAVERKRSERALARLAVVMGALCDECGRKVAPPGGRVPES
jgi:DNA-binding response OmpR family regulator